MKRPASAGIVLGLVLALVGVGLIATPAASRARAQDAAQPTATPAAGQPIRLTDGVVLVEYVAAAHDGDIYVFGEMRNEGTAGARTPVLRFTFRDAAGGVVLEDYAFGTWGWVAAGDTMPFSEIFGRFDGVTQAPGDWSEVSVEAVGPTGPFGSVPTDTLVISEIPAAGPYPEAALEGEDLVGRVDNTGDAEIDDLSVYVAQYDEGGRVVGVCIQDVIVGGPDPGRYGRFAFTYEDCRSSIAGKAIRGSAGPYTYKIVLAPLNYDLAASSTATPSP